MVDNNYKGGLRPAVVIAWHSLNQHTPTDKAQDNGRWQNNWSSMSYRHNPLGKRIVEGAEPGQHGMSDDMATVGATIVQHRMLVAGAIVDMIHGRQGMPNNRVLEDCKMTAIRRAIDNCWESSIPG